MQPIRIETTAPRSIAVVQHIARPRDFSTIVPQSCGTVWTFLRTNNVPNPGRNVAVYRDAETGGRIRLEVGVEVDGPIPAHAEVVMSSLPAGRVATVTHFGPYGELGVAHTALRAWAAKAGGHFAGPNWEIYGHWDAAWNTNPQAIRTDLFYLLK